MLEHQDFWLEIIKVIPSYLWVIGAFVAFLLLYDLYSRQLVLSAYAKQQQERLADLSQVERALDDVLAVAARNPHWHIEVSAADKAQVLRRLQGSGEMLSGCRVLWLDNRPDTLVNEIRLLQYLGLNVITVTSAGEALGHLKQTSCELLVSDIARPKDSRMASQPCKPCTIITPACPRFSMWVISMRKMACLRVRLVSLTALMNCCT